MNSSLNSIGVVVVTYYPEGDAEARLAMMASQGAALVVVDNDSGAEVRARLGEICVRRGWELLVNLENLGLGVALNQGVQRLEERGFLWVLMFDQDSEPAEGMSGSMLETLQNHPDGGRVAVVGANFLERATGRRHRILQRHPRAPVCFQKIAPGEADLPEVSMVITSGSMVRVADFEALGRFDEGFFIDYVDTDFCLRCVERGRLIAVSAAARFDHEFGRRTRRRWCGIEVRPTNHPPLRHYYIARNRVAVWRRHAWRAPHWAMADLSAALVWAVRVVTVESAKGRKLRAIALGTWDGLRGKNGPCPEGRRDALSG